MTTRPTDEILFAESAAGGDVADPSGVRAAGYPFEAPVPYEEFNYLFRAPGRWIDWLARGGVHEDIQSLNDWLEAGETGECLPETNYVPHRWASTIGSLPASITDIHCDGRYLLVLRGSAAVAGVVYLADLEGGGVNILTLDSVPTSTEHIIGNGQNIIVGYDGNKIECLNYSGTTVWSYTSLGTINDIAMDNDYVYVAASNGLFQLDLSGGALNDAEETLDPYVAVASDGDLVYCIRSTGNLLTLQAIGLGVRWSATGTDPTAATVDSTVQTNGRKVVFAARTGTGVEYFLYSREGSLIGSDIVASSTVRGGIDIDGDFFYAGVNNEIRVYSMETGDQVGVLDDTFVTSSVGPITTNGRRIYFKDGNDVGSFYASRQAPRWRKTNYDEKFVPRIQSIYPLE